MDEWGTAGFKRPGQNFKNSISSGVGSRKSISGRRQETGIQSAVRFPHHAQDRVDFEGLLCFGSITIEPNWEEVTDVLMIGGQIEGEVGLNRIRGMGEFAGSLFF